MRGSGGRGYSWARPELRNLSTLGKGFEMRSPLVSIVLSTHNYGCFIAETIDSLLAQSYRHFEIIVVDDASQDDTQEVLRQFRDDRIVLLNRSVCSNSGEYARNDGLAIARGDLIAVADADDLYKPYRLEAQIAYLNAHPETDLLGGGMKLIDRVGNPIDRPVERPVFKRPELYRQTMLSGQDVLFHSTLMFRASVLDRVKGYRNYPTAGDFEFILRASRYHNLHNLELGLAYRRRHDGSVSKRHSGLNQHYRRYFVAKEYRWIMREIHRLSRTTTLTQ